MSEQDKVEKVGKVHSKSSSLSTEEAQPIERAAPNKELFDGLVAEQQGSPVRNETSENAIKRASLMEELRDVDGRVDKFDRKTPQQVLEQTHDLIAQIDEIKTKLKTENLKFEPSVEQLMRGKLEHIDDKLRLALQKAGGEYTPLETRQARSSLADPIGRFLGYLENGEVQLTQIGQRVVSLGDNAQSINPAQLLAIQIKVGYVQNELEFFTSLLNKALESTKTIMNVQV